MFHITVQLGAKGTVQCILRQSDRSNHDGFDALPSLLLSKSHLQHMSSRTLFRMLCGHVYYPDILAITLSIGMLRQVQVPWPWRHIARTGIWQGFVTKSLEQLALEPFSRQSVAF